jgi:hypothetical protein
MLTMLVTSLQIIISTPSVPYDPHSGLAGHDSHTDMSAVPAEDQPSNCNNE